MAAAQGWAPSDHFALWQLVIAFFGFAIAIWQLVRTANATERSADALTKRLLSNDLLIALPELQRIEDEIDRAVKAPDPDRVSSALLTFHRQASSIIGHLRTDSELINDPAIKKIEATLKAASEAKGAIQDGSTDPLVDIVRAFRRKSDASNAAIADLVARLQRGHQRTKEKK